MMHEKSDDAVVEGYNFSAPDGRKAVQSFARILGESDAEDLWKKACEQQNVDSTTKNLDDLEAVYRFLSTRPGKTGVVGKSMMVRLRSFKILSQNA